MFDFDFVPPPLMQSTSKMKKAKPGFQSTRNCTALVTGSSGLVGARLVEMLLERGADKVICFDIVPPSPKLIERFTTASSGNKNRFKIFSGPKDGDLVNKDAVLKACSENIEIIYHIAALVGPFHDRDKYYAVNVDGTKNLLDACKNYKIFYFVNASSPSTRFDGSDITGQTEDELSFPSKYVQLYAETKAVAERTVTEANCNSLLTISVAPHQVYGPYDTLFLAQILETSGNQRLRIFGKGKNKISVCYVDNYCHGLMCAADALESDSPVLGKFYIVTDDHDVYFWQLINEASMAMCIKDLFSKFHLPVWLLMFLAYICNGLGFILNKKFKLSPFTVRMMIIHRYFSVENAKRDLLYEPVVDHDEAWKGTIEWFRVNWLPTFLAENNKDSKHD